VIAQNLSELSEQKSYAELANMQFVEGAFVSSEFRVVLDTMGKVAS
jgi:hypothetical protein